MDIQLPPNSLLVVGLRGFDQDFRRKVVAIFDLDMRSVSDYEAFVYILQESARQICTGLSTDSRSFLQLLLQLPDLRYFQQYPQMAVPDRVKRFGDALKEFGVRLLSCVQSTPYFHPSYDYFIEHFDEGRLILQVHPKGMHYE